MNKRTSAGKHLRCFYAVLICSGPVSVAQAGDSTSGLLYLGYAIWAGFFVCAAYLIWSILRNILLKQGKKAINSLVALILVLVFFWHDLSQVASGIFE